MVHSAMVSSFRQSDGHENANRRRPPNCDPEARAPIAHPRRQLHGLILRSDAQHRVSKDGPARSLVGAPWSVLRDAALRAAPQDEGGFGVTKWLRIRRNPLKRLVSRKGKSLDFASTGLDFPS